MPVRAVPLALVMRRLMGWFNWGLETRTVGDVLLSTKCSTDVLAYTCGDILPMMSLDVPIDEWYDVGCANDDQRM